MVADIVDDMEVGMVADIKVDMVADIKVDKVADMVADIDVDMVANTNIDIHINMEIQFGERFGHGGWLIGFKLFRLNAYPTFMSSMLCEFNSITHAKI